MAISVKNNCAIKTGLFPELAVTAPAGSTIDLMISSVVVQTYTLGTAETTHTFYDLTVGTTYTVSATDGSRTATRTVLIDENAKFGVGIAFQTYLYDEGDECTALTGGWYGYRGVTTYYRSMGTLTKGEASMSLSCGYFQECAVSHNTAIDFTGFNTLNFLVDSFTAPGSSAHITVGATDNKITDLYWASHKIVVSSTGIKSVSVTDLTDNMYAMFQITTETSTAATLTISKIWLE